jgi:hypothetical protein
VFVAWSYPEYTAPAEYYVVICGLFRLYNIFARYIIDGAIFLGWGALKCVFWYALQILTEILLILRRIQGGYHKCTQYFMESKGKGKGKAVPLQAW